MFDPHGLIAFGLVLLAALLLPRLVAESNTPSEWTTGDVVLGFGVLTAASFVEIPDPPSAPASVGLLFTLVARAALVLLALYCIICLRRRVSVTVLWPPVAGARLLFFKSFRVVLAAVLLIALFGSLGRALDQSAAGWLAIPGPPQSGSPLHRLMILPLPYLLASLGYFLSEMLLLPIFEEVFFRAFVMRPFLIKFGPWPAILLSAAVWTSLHPFTVLDVVAKLGIGMVFGYLYVRTGSLVPSVTLHICANSLVTLKSLLGDLHDSSALALPVAGLALLALVWISSLIAESTPERAALRER